ncbi:MAG: 2-oxoacid:acceptor oxidoreductase family protein [Oscillospiraceae bacterium]
MKEIRLHGRGGQGVVKASQMVVKAAVEGGLHGQFIPFFGVERKGSPVFGYLRLSTEEIRRKTQIYEPDVLVIMDDTLVGLPQTYAGLKDGGTVLINSTKPLSELGVPDCAGVVAEVDATGISERLFGQNLPNTAVLGAFTKVGHSRPRDSLRDRHLRRGEPPRGRAGIRERELSGREARPVYDREYVTPWATAACTS